MNDSIIGVVDDALNKLEKLWGKWQPMPENRKSIIGPQNSGVYQIRNKESNELILFGVGKKCQERMKLLYGGRNNLNKINHVLNYWKALEYRTMETNCREEAEAVEGLLKAKKNHCFNT
jgi:hypothetical protein